MVAANEPWSCRRHAPALRELDHPPCEAMHAPAAPQSETSRLGLLCYAPSAYLGTGNRSRETRALVGCRGSPLRRLPLGRHDLGGPRSRSRGQPFRDAKRETRNAKRETRTPNSDRHSSKADVVPVVHANAELCRATNVARWASHLAQALYSA